MAEMDVVLAIPMFDDSKSMQCRFPPGLCVEYGMQSLGRKEDIVTCPYGQKELSKYMIQLPKATPIRNRLAVPIGQQ